MIDLKSTVKLCAIVAALAVSGGAPAHAASPEGVWLTQPDKKGGFAHIQARPCGPSICGVVLRAFDASGNQITTPNVGKMVFWDMQPDAKGRYKGRAWVPAHNREYNGVIRVSGNTMKVSGCLGPVCQSQVWKRVK